LKYLNRTILIVKPKQPLVDWMNSFDEDEVITLAEVEADAEAYLIAECEDEKDMEKLIQQHYQEIFQEQLNNLIADPEGWPEITESLFHEWFSLELYTMVGDLDKKPLTLEEF